MLQSPHRWFEFHALLYEFVGQCAQLGDADHDDAETRELKLPVLMTLQPCALSKKSLTNDMQRGRHLAKGYDFTNAITNKSVWRRN